MTFWVIIFIHYLDLSQQNEDLTAPQSSAIVFTSATLAVTEGKNL